MKNQLTITRADNGFICESKGKILVFKKSVDIIKTMARDIDLIPPHSKFIIEYEKTTEDEK